MSEVEQRLARMRVMLACAAFMFAGSALLAIVVHAELSDAERSLEELTERLGSKKLFAVYATSGFDQAVALAVRLGTSQKVATVPANGSANRRYGDIGVARPLPGSIFIGNGRCLFDPDGDESNLWMCDDLAGRNHLRDISGHTCLYKEENTEIFFPDGNGLVYSRHPPSSVWSQMGQVEQQ